MTSLVWEFSSLQACPTLNCRVWIMFSSHVVSRPAPGTGLAGSRPQAWSMPLPALHHSRHHVAHVGSSRSPCSTPGNPIRSCRAVRAAAGAAPSSGPTDRPGIQLQNLAAKQGQEVRRLKMVVSYDGSAFAGFQWQAGKTRTVQAELERASQRLFLGASRMVGASRTDGGAHAYGQVVHFDVRGSRDDLATDLMFFNAFLPADVKAVKLEYAPPGFDSHFSSLGKTYKYHIVTTPDPLRAKSTWWVYDRYCERSRGKPLSHKELALDVGLMQQGAQVLLGRHDFSAFMDDRRPAGLGALKRKKPHLAEKGIKPVRTAAKNTRTLGELHVEEVTSPLTGGQEIILTLTGDGFLYRMVRMIAAALVEVGHGRISPQRLSQILEAGDRKAFPEAAPPHGLFLWRVWYPEDREEMMGRCPDEQSRAALEAATCLTSGQRSKEQRDDDGDGPPTASSSPSSSPDKEQGSEEAEGAGPGSASSGGEEEGAGEAEAAAMGKGRGG